MITIESLRELPDEYLKMTTSREEEFPVQECWRYQVGKRRYGEPFYIYFWKENILPDGYES